MRATDSSGELPIPSDELFSDTEVLGRMAMERMLAGLSTRRYPVGLSLSVRGWSRPRWHLEVGGLAPVRRGHRDRPGRAAGRGPVEAGSGG
jgi:hypothetical protein